MSRCLRRALELCRPLVIENNADVNMHEIAPGG